MGCAALAVDTDPLTEVRTMAHRQLDQWLDQMLPLFEQEKPPTLLELSKHFTRTRTTLLGGVLQSINESLYAHFLDQKQSECPRCATRLNRKRIDTKRYNSLQGAGTLDRPYFYCRGCKIGFHPLDEALELTRSFHQYDIEEKVLKLATEMPYERAAELVSELTGVPVSNRHSHQTLTQVAATPTWKQSSLNGTRSHGASSRPRKHRMTSRYWSWRWTAPMHPLAPEPSATRSAGPANGARLREFASIWHPKMGASSKSPAGIRFRMPTQ